MGCCPCRNVCLHLDRAPTQQEMPFWLSDNFKLPKGIGKATLVPVPGVTQQVPILCIEKVIEKDDQTWNCLVCVNCETFIYAEKATGGSPILVNMILQPKPEKEQQQRQLSSIYSPVWKIILKDEDDCASSVIETPDPNDEKKYEHFINLQRQMQEFLSAEEEAMRCRIREYEQKQYEELRELKTRSIRDRKVLWYRVNQELSKNKEDEVIVISNNVDTIPDVNDDPLAAGELDEDQPADSPDASVVAQSSPKKNKWMNPKFKAEKTTSSDWLFQFDDEEFEKSQPDPPDDLSDDFDDEIDTSESRGYDESNDYRSPEFHMAASVPVAIPANRFTNPPPKKASKSPPSKSRRVIKPFEGTFDIPEAVDPNADNEILSKSFAIPRSRNRVRGWM